ncbi:Nucleolar protein 16 [Vanrija pseudolonga]|uniref:Nucleolar protein 16 n=1 Tax=Vanrija pseudolonga TaxID=143232 RepID=A0AAF1BJF3_9TREE|nr:Nucleolar protein 16 [Vanrija pseudolonga]
MANPRQRSKAKSHRSTKPSLNQKRRMHQKLRKAPPLKGPEALQEAWDKKKTVFQNYAALGLLPSIPVDKGARNQRVKLPLAPPTDDDGDADMAEAAPAPSGSFGRIIRDADGNIVDIVLDDEEEVVEVEEPKAEGSGSAKPLNVETAPLAPVVAKTEVVRKLESLAASAAPVIRHTSTAERMWLVSSVQKHGDDYEAMAKDRKLNVWQKTPGELKRMVRKAGGVQKLLA